jgi:4'-phosphopantetheinyl transferase
MTEVWALTTRALPLEPGMVDLYGGMVGAFRSRLPEFSQLLCEAEQVRAERYRYDKDREEFVIGRGLLRRLLGQYLGVGPEAVTFTYGKHGKPSVEGMWFNLAHSGGWLLYGVCGDRPIGVDIEQVKPMPELDKLSGRFFTKTEARLVQSLGEPLKTETFFRIWTAKEAYLKATGAGLGQIKSLEVRCNPGQASELINPQGWELEAVALAEGLVGTVAAEGLDWRLRRWGLAPEF